jgi:predicted subunit of tRNA(5-methylaminomethyl-2-thiouridylate) methyltransferase
MATEHGKPDSADADLMATMFERLLSKYDLVKKESVSTQRDDKVTKAEVTAAKSVKRK